MRPAELLTSVLLFSAVSSAWPSGWEPLEALKQEVAPILKRQDDKTSFDLSYSSRQGNTATTESSAEETSTGDNNDSSTTDSNDSTATSDSDSKTTDSGSKTGSATGSEKTTGTAKETGSSKGSGTKSGTQTTKTFDARLPAGGVSMITPNAMTSSYFKINNFITFAWNYTSLSVTPSAVDILASCSLNQETYTIALNQTIDGPKQTVIWDTGAYQASATVPLLTETYTLIIHDAAKDVSATAMAGYLGTYNQFTFGMYSPQPYTPMAEWVCATCNSALTAAERQTLFAIFAMAGVTVLSFGWFTGVAGLW
ncbi:hypothetical protein M409DRAFT_22581 [Zasmidium cellare ATCC 36951]|uniref:DUF7137 domain-containing protein n=1 Tax=Zasmidium cellare ATCC 36951 TaxID=1080233 RepID=A0A6A6CMK3_ZASCE|nr:uncharacterized protein M409DRAFT_22581 [Zasmidium cellare ATCC 36951]KAF2167152.1 hypothetical protein M409DRAFT_22581 [Zasmidium cellare ATCC 36951]